MCGCGDEFEPQNTVFNDAVAVAVNSGNPRECESLRGLEDKNPGFVDSCYSSVASKVLTTEACGLISNADKKTDCRTRVAVATKNPLTCSEIEGEGKRDCLSRVAVEILNSASESAEEKYNDIYDMLNGRGSHCENIESETSQDYLRNKCYLTVALKHNDPDMCRKITGMVGDSNDCITSIAYQSKDNNLCNEITSEFKKDYCTQSIILDMVKESQNIELCQNMGSVEKANNCYKEAAVRLGFSSACYKLPTGSEQKACISEVVKYNPL